MKRTQAEGGEIMKNRKKMSAIEKTNGRGCHESKKTFTKPEHYRYPSSEGAWD